MQWIDSHGVSYTKLRNKKAALLCTKQTGDSLENGTSGSLIRRKHSPTASVNVPEVREKFWRMNMIYLNQWKKKEKCFNLAESICDAIQNGTSEDLKEECKSNRGIENQSSLAPCPQERG